MRRLTKLLTVLTAAAVLAPAALAAVGSCVSRQVIAPRQPVGDGQPAPNIRVRVCNSSATGTPCSPLATGGLFTDPALTHSLSNPLATDENGIYFFCAAQATYLIQETPQQGTVYSYLVTTPSIASGNATQLQSVPISTTTPVLNDALMFDGTQWVPQYPNNLQGVLVNPTPPVPPSVLCADLVAGSPQWQACNATVGQKLAFFYTSTPATPPTPYSVSGWSVACDDVQVGTPFGIDSSCSHILLDPNPSGLYWATTFSPCLEYGDGPSLCANVPPSQLPHWAVIDMGTVQPVGTVGYVPHANIFYAGNIVGYNIYLRSDSGCGSDGAGTWGAPVATGNLDPTGGVGPYELMPITGAPSGRCVKVEVTSVADNRLAIGFVAVAVSIRLWPTVLAPISPPSHAVLVDELEVDARAKGIDCTGTVDSAFAISQLSLDGNHIKFGSRQCLKVRVDSPILLQNIRSLWFDGGGIKPGTFNTATEGTMIFGCNGTAGDALIEGNGLGMSRITGFHLVPDGAAAGLCGGDPSNFTTSVALRRTTGSTLTPTQVEVDNNYMVPGGASSAWSTFSNLGLSKTGWTIACSSTLSGFPCSSLLTETSVWQSDYVNSPNLPQYAVVDMVTPATVGALAYFPEYLFGGGTILGYTVATSTNSACADGATGFSNVVSGTWHAINKWQIASWTPATARCVKLIATATYPNNLFAGGAAIRLYTSTPTAQTYVANPVDGFAGISVPDAQNNESMYFHDNYIDCAHAPNSYGMFTSNGNSDNVRIEGNQIHNCRYAVGYGFTGTFRDNQVSGSGDYQYFNEETGGGTGCAFQGMSGLFVSNISSEATGQFGCPFSEEGPGGIFIGNTMGPDVNNLPPHIPPGASNLDCGRCLVQPRVFIGNKTSGSPNGVPIVSGSLSNQSFSQFIDGGGNDWRGNYAVTPKPFKTGYSENIVTSYNHNQFDITLSGPSHQSSTANSPSAATIYEATVTSSGAQTALFDDYVSRNVQSKDGATAASTLMLYHRINPLADAGVTDLGIVLGAKLAGGLVTRAAATVAAPTLAVTGSAASATYGYKVVGVSTGDLTYTSTETTIATAPSTLTTANFVNIKLDVPFGYHTLKIYRTTTPGGGPATGLIASVEVPEALYGDGNGQAKSGCNLGGSNYASPPTVQGCFTGQTIVFYDIGQAGDSTSPPATTADGRITSPAVVTGNQIQSTVTTGTAPLIVASTTNVPNLNASSLSGATFAAPGPIGSGTPSTGAFTTVSTTGQFTSTVSTGTAPFSIASTTAVPNLNASFLNGATFASPSAIGGGTPNAGSFTTLSASSQITSLLATGTAPFVIASTTPVANLTTVPLTYNHSGTQQTATHLVQDSCTLGTDCGVTLTGAAVYTSSTSYTCVCEDDTAVAACKVAQSSGSAFTITGTGTDSIRYVCTGN